MGSFLYMKVFFNASVTGRKEFEKEYRAIDAVLRGLPYELIASPTFTATAEDVKRETTRESTAYFKKLVGWIKSSDINIFEVSYPSLGIGHEVAMSLDLGKPTIVLYLKGKEPFVFMARETEAERLQVVSYDLFSLKKDLSSSIRLACDQLETRFTLILNSDVRKRLDNVASKGLSRSEYIRELIRKDMEGK